MVKNFAKKSQISIHIKKYILINCHCYYMNGTISSIYIMMQHTAEIKLGTKCLNSILEREWNMQSECRFI